MAIRRIRIRWGIRAMLFAMAAIGFGLTIFGSSPAQKLLQNERSKVAISVLSRTSKRFYCDDKWGLDDGGETFELAAWSARSWMELGLGIPDVPSPLFAEFYYSAPSPQDIGVLADIKGLTFERCELTVDHVKALGNCSQLRVLKCPNQNIGQYALEYEVPDSNAPANGLDWRAVFQLRELRNLDVSCCDVDPSVLHTANLPLLEIINLKGISLPSESLISLTRNAPKMKTLTLSGAKGEGLVAILQLAHLRDLYLSESGLNESVLRRATQQRRLRYMATDNVLSTESLRLIVSKFPNLRFIAFGARGELSREMQDSFRSMPDLSLVRTFDPEDTTNGTVYEFKVYDTSGEVSLDKCQQQKLPIVKKAKTY